MRHWKKNWLIWEVLSSFFAIQICTEFQKLSRKTKNCLENKLDLNLIWDFEFRIWKTVSDLKEFWIWKEILNFKGSSAPSQILDGKERKNSTESSESAKESPKEETDAKQPCGDLHSIGDRNCKGGAKRQYFFSSTKYECLRYYIQYLNTV